MLQKQQALTKKPSGIPSGKRGDYIPGHYNDNGDWVAGRYSDKSVQWLWNEWRFSCKQTI